MEIYLCGVWVIACCALLPAFVREPFTVFVTAAVLGTAVVRALYLRNDVASEHVPLYLASMLMGSCGASLAAKVYEKR